MSADSFVPIPLDVVAASPAPAELAGLSRPARIAWLRAARLCGICVDFHPYRRDDGEALRALRNQPHNKEKLAQPGDITAEQQRAWEDGYFARDNDLCWILRTPAGAFAGAVSLYDIGADEAETGRLVVAEDIARSTPILAETELMIQLLAFAWLGLTRVTARIQPGNVKMIAMHERLGFLPTGPTEIRGVPYAGFAVTPERYAPAPHRKVLEHWRRRATPPATTSPSP